MRIDRLTAKMQEALQESQALASNLQHQEIAPEHLLLALIRQPDPNRSRNALLATSQSGQKFRVANSTLATNCERF